MSERIFALDIGTQSVTGVILETSNDTYTVLDYCIEQHNERAMLDGQIHDVIKVAEIIDIVKSKLAMSHGELTSVRVAAAGRALKTVRAQASMSLQGQPITTEETVRYLELTAVQNAQMELLDEMSKQSKPDYYCVGYSVSHYSLDGDPIGSLIDQKGEEATVEVISTFLPHVVVESLLASLQRSNLTMEALTLEPIAAIHILIPDSMRRLNIALVDIGAGTSDIAITRDGTVTAYGMVAEAGDEITEAISDHYLLDFDEAETAKRKVVQNQSANVTDILGFSSTITLEEMIEAIAKPTEMLALSLANEILSLNHKAPQAIMLIGGGSLTPNIDQLLAEKLQLPKNRIAIRTLDAIQNVKNLELMPQGPDFITPLGIAITSINNPITYTSVTINERVYRIFDANELTVGDTLIHAGISVRTMYGSPGLAYMITFNGKSLTLPGQLGSPPIIRLNGNPATLDDPVNDGDKLLFEKGLDGNNPFVSIKELVDDIHPITISINQQQYTYLPKYIVNGSESTDEHIVQDKDEIIVYLPKTVDDIITHLDGANSQKGFPVYVDGQLLNINKGQTTYKLNGEQVPSSTLIKENDQLLITYAEQPIVNDVIKQLNESFTKKITVTFNDKPVQIEKEILEITREGHKISHTTPILPNDQLLLNRKKQISFIFQDVFRFVDFDTTDIQGHYKISINNQLATFFDTIQDGDVLAIR